MIYKRRLRRLERDCGRNTLKIYPDSNIYILGLTASSSDEAYVLDNMTEPNFEIVQSDYLIEEVLRWFRQRKGRSYVGKIWYYYQTIPNREIISKYEWSLYLDDVKDLVEDVDDIPHICSYICADADYFITKDDRLAKMEISQLVNFISAKEFKEKFLTKL